MRISLLLTMLWAGLSVMITAQPAELVPGSILLFPTVDSRAGAARGTMISVTNTSASRIVSPTNNFRNGDIQLHYYYLACEDGFTHVFNRKEFLTPNDTLTVFAGSHNPETERGYLLVVAEDPETEVAVKFNYLIGDEVVVDLQQNQLWGIPAISFRARASSGATDNNGRVKTDHATSGGNGNGSVDFDGVEYDFYPDQLMISSFFEQTLLHETRLVLVSPLGAYYLVQVNFLFYDNEEDVYSRNYRFSCWTEEVLSDISAVTRRLGGTSTEMAMGWARIDGDHAINVYTGLFWDNETEGQGTTYDPPILGVMSQRVLPGPGYAFGHLLHHTGTQNGNEFPFDYADD